MVDKVTESCKTVDKYTVAILTEETKVLVGHLPISNETNCVQLVPNSYWSNHGNAKAKQN